ncbi:MAG: hypothetical protein P4K93_06175 [Terracidiphilus sp.]|nr:hypothetical protein [Terracidiphilus sp.]
MRASTPAPVAARLRIQGVWALALSVFSIAGSALYAQTTPTASPANEPPAPTAQPDQSPTFATPPVAIVPLDKSIPGAALDVAGSLQTWNGRAYLTASGSISAGTATAEVTLPYRGTLRICASSTVKLAADASAPVGEVPGLLIALDRGAVEMSFAASTAREKNADTLQTPYFRILIGGPNAADVKVRLGEHGDTCVDNAGANAPYVVVSSVFEGGVYRVQPGQRVMFEHGSLQSVVDQEKEPCGCPPPVKSEGNEFPLAQSEGLAPGSAQAPVVTAPPPPVANASTALSYNGADHAAQIAAPATPAPAASATPPPQTPAPQKKPGFFGKIGRFFKRMFGAE